MEHFAKQSRLDDAIAWIHQQCKRKAKQLQRQGVRYPEPVPDGLSRRQIFKLWRFGSQLLLNSKQRLFATRGEIRGGKIYLLDIPNDRSELRQLVFDLNWWVFDHQGIQLTDTLVVDTLRVTGKADAG